MKEINETLEQEVKQFMEKEVSNFISAKSLGKAAANHFGIPTEDWVWDLAFEIMYQEHV